MDERVPRWSHSPGVAGVAFFAVAYNVPRYFESTLVWNATEDVGNGQQLAYYLRQSCRSSEK